MTSEEVLHFGRAVSDELAVVLGDGLVGVYFVGSVALGGYVAGESDIDIIAVSQAALGSSLKLSVIDAVERAIGSCPARGLEFTLYRSEVAGAASDGAAFEVNVNGGQRMERVVRTESETEPAFWYVLDRGVAHRSGVVIVGPPAADVFADIDRAVLLLAIADSMRWHRTHEGTTLYSVLNAARAWRFAAEDVLGSKLEGATWAIERWHRPAVIEAAVQLRHGHPAMLEATDVAELLAHVEHVLATAE